MFLKLIEQVSLSFISSVGFAIIMRVPKDSIIYSGLSGAGGWFVYWVGGLVGLSVTVATFFGALTIAAISYYFARHRHTPATLYNIPGIVALVPGGISYQMTYHLIIGEYRQAMHYGIRVAAIAGAIAGGLIVFDLARRNLRYKRIR